MHDAKLVRRFDSSNLGKAERLDNGFLKVPIRAARTGILVYPEKNGGQRRELVSPDVLFERESLDSLKHQEVVGKHPFYEPTRQITSKNAKNFSVGHLTEKVEPFENRFLDAEAIITDENTIQDILSDKCEVSCGYDSRIEPTSGWWNPETQKFVVDSDLGENAGNAPFHPAERFDAIQISRKYNHIAKTPKGRAGSECRFILDEDDNIKMEEKTPMKKISIKGKDHEVPEEVYDHVQELKNDSDSKKATCDAMEKRCMDAEKKLKDSGETKHDSAEYETLLNDHKEMRGKLDSIEAENKRLNDPKTLDKHVAERMGIIESAKTHMDSTEFEKVKGLSNLEIMKAVIKSGNVTVNLDGEDERYIKGRFEGLVGGGTSGGAALGEKFLDQRHMDAKTISDSEGNARQKHYDSLNAFKRK